MITKKRMKTICSIFFDAGKNFRLNELLMEERFEEIFEYYWDELNTVCNKHHPSQEKK